MEPGNAFEPQSYLLVSRRNNSLSSTGKSLVLGSFVLISLAISLPFAFHGAWLILPFAGAQMAVLYLAFRAVERHAGDFESISISGDRLVVERSETGRVSRHEFNRCWAQVVFEPGAPGGGEVLALRSHGRLVELGRHLTHEQRREVARTLKQHLSGR
jgi:uncharacterized membrane protein